MSNDKDFKVKNGIQPTAYHEAVGTVVSGSVPAGYADVLTWSYDNVSFATGSQDSQLSDIAFNSNGTKMYMMGSTTDNIYQYSLSIAYDISTASYDSVSFSVASQDAIPISLAFSNDGTKMFITGYNSAGVHQYILSTAFDLSTASYDNYKFSISSQDILAYGLTFNPDGTKMYVLGAGNKNVYQYSLYAPFNVRTASYSNNLFYVGSQDASPQAVAFNAAGTKMYLIGQTGDDISQYTLSTAFNVDTASYDNKVFFVGGQSTSPQNLKFNNDGTKVYVASYSNDSVYQYSTDFTLPSKTLDLSTGSVFEITPTSDIQVSLSNPAASGSSSGATLLLNSAALTTYDIANAVYDNVIFNVSAQETSPQGIFFKPDGTKMYVVGATGDDVNEYNLSTPWDISTASFLQLFSVAAQETVPYGLFFKPDGTKMYVVGAIGQDVNEYNLSTPWDISTASFLQLKSVAAQDTSPQDLFFKDDGTKMYVVGATGDDINEYNLSTAWDISTASFLQLKSVAAQETSPTGISFKPDGTKMYVTGNTGNDVNEYNLSTPWNISTAVFNQLFSVGSQSTVPQGIFFKPDGTKMYVVGSTSATIYQYSTALLATITYGTPIQFSGGLAPTAPAIGDTDVLTFNTTDGGTTYKSAIAIDGAS